MNKIKRLWRNLVTLWEIADDFDDINIMLNEKINAVDRRLGEFTTVHADIHYEQSSQVIVIGRFHNRDYVRCYDIDEASLPELINYLKEKERGAKVGRFDMPHSHPFSVVYERDRF